MAPPEATLDGLLAHIAAQTTSNIEFLVAHNYLPKADAAGVLAKLGTLRDAGAVSALSDSVQQTVLKSPKMRSASASSSNVGAQSPTQAQRKPQEQAQAQPQVPKQAQAQAQQRAIPPPVKRTAVAPPRRVVKARALWDYNEGEADDLSFNAGDVIEIVEETNDDWWTGKFNGHQGVFPANYVEKIAAPTERTPPAPPPAPSARSSYFDVTARGPSPNPSAGSVTRYASPPGPPPPWQQDAPPQGYGFPHAYPQPSPWQEMPYEKQPPPQDMVYYGTPPPMQMQMQPPPEQPPKKSRFGGLGNVLATSAVGGVGFGAGSAIGGGLIDAIF